MLRELTQSMKSSGEKALVAFFTAGYPDEETFLRLLDAASQVGCQVIEIGIPFSDPIADGPLIQESSKRALENGMSLRKATSAFSPDDLIDHVSSRSMATTPGSLPLRCPCRPCRRG